MTHDIIGQQLDEALRLATTAKPLLCAKCGGVIGVVTSVFINGRVYHPECSPYAEETGKVRGHLKYQAEQVFREFIEEYGPELAPYKLSEILENEKQRVQQ